MKQYIALAIGLLTSVGVAAQDCTKKAQKLIIDKIKNYNPTDLVPYSEDGNKWALVDVKSKKLVTGFIFKYPETFTPIFSGYLNKCAFAITSNYTHTKMSMGIPEPPPPSLPNIATKEDLGFDVNDGEITAYSKEYEKIRYDNSYPVSEPILYKGKYYAILRKEKEKILIDQKGVEQDEFSFKVMFSIKHKNNGEEVFYVEDKQGQKGFITLSGRKILYGELFHVMSDYRTDLDYSVQMKDMDSLGKYYGVLDLIAQTWLIKPQNQYEILDIIFSSTEEIDKYKEGYRDKIKVFFLATDKKGKKRFVLDKNGTPILPKK